MTNNFLRKNAWNKNGTFSNPDLLWYAKGVGVMQSRALNDENSWWFFAAIHGEYIKQRSFPGWGYLPAPPSVPTTPAPSNAIQKQFWNQCQHQSWYFAPWHRGYLIALEAQIREAVISLGGPSDWALPYWNYLGPNNENRIPPAFTELKLPDGSPNPLLVDARYGPNNDGNVYVRVSRISYDCQNNTIYTGSNANTPSPGYGGPQTGFSHGGGTSGNLESNPHNIVHVEVGGSGGLMSDPGLAALDPIFYLHHCNIDRLWANWNAAGNPNPTKQNWLKGPASIGEREFVMPLPGSQTWVYTPKQMNSISGLGYSYDGSAPKVATPNLVNSLTLRLNKLGVSSQDVAEDVNANTGKKIELVGASEKSMKLATAGIKTAVKLDKSWRKVPLSLVKASTKNLPDRIYLQLENVKGNIDANLLDVTINHKLAGHISLFGLRNASDKDGHHGGSGLTFTLDITDIIDDMHLRNSLKIQDLEVSVFPDKALADDHKITVERISIYREGHKL